MAIGILGKKLGMTQVYVAEDGRAVPVTVMEAGPCTVVRKRSAEKNRYSALQLGFEDVKAFRVNLPRRGQFKHLGEAPKRFLREFRVDEETLGRYEEGQKVTVELFEKGDRVDVTGTSKGRGFAGVVKRHGFAGFKATHGTHEYFRHAGGIGACAYPGKVWKGQKMAGHMGAERVTTQNLEVVEVRPEENLLLLKGAVPGSMNGLVMIRKAIRGERWAKAKARADTESAEERKAAAKGRK